MLLFTMLNVQRFAASRAPEFMTVWWAAWLLDPMVSLVLLAVGLLTRLITGGAGELLASSRTASGAQSVRCAANYFTAGVKGRWQEERRKDDHLLV